MVIYGALVEDFLAVSVGARETVPLGAVVVVDDPGSFAFPVSVRTHIQKLTVRPVTDPRRFALTAPVLAPIQAFA